MFAILCGTLVKRREEIRALDCELCQVGAKV
jgi:hypothetical protein